MHTFLDAPAHVIAVRYEGKLDKADIDATFDRCRETLKAHAKISAYVDLTHWQGFTADGLLEELKEAFPALGWMGRVHRKAVVTDNRALHAWTAFATSLIAQPQAKAFWSTDAAAALAWASEPPTPDLDD